MPAQINNEPTPIICSRCGGVGIFFEIPGMPDCPDCDGRGAFRYPPTDAQTNKYHSCPLEPNLYCQCPQKWCIAKVSKAYKDQITQTRNANHNHSPI